MKNKESIKLIAIDLDGTLLNNQKELPQRNIEAIGKAIDQGFEIVICTGRTLPGVRHLMEQLPLQGKDGYLILQNGTVTHHLPDLEVLSQTTLQAEARQALASFTAPYDGQGGTLVSFDRDNMWVSTEYAFSDWVIKDAANLKTEPQRLLHRDFIQTETLHKAMVLADPTVLDEIEQAVTDTVRSHLSPVRSLDFVLEFLPNGSNKASALKQLTAHLGFQAHEVMAIGDQLNDLEMIEWAGTGVAMGNAVEALVAVSDVQTGTNDAAGVAQIIEQLLK